MIDVNMLKLLALGLAGLATGAGAAVGAGQVMEGGALFRAEHAPEFVATGPVVAPLVAGDGRLLGYFTFEAQVQVRGDQAARVRNGLPILLDAVNQRTFDAPIAGGPDGLVPRLTVVRTILQQESRRLFGPAVMGVSITQATMN